MSSKKRQMSKYDHSKVQAAYRKADRTAYGLKHGNTKRKLQQDHTTHNRQRT